MKNKNVKSASKTKPIENLRSIGNIIKSANNINSMEKEVPVGNINSVEKERPTSNLNSIESI